MRCASRGRSSVGSARPSKSASVICKKAKAASSGTSSWFTTAAGAVTRPSSRSRAVLMRWSGVSSTPTAADVSGRRGGGYVHSLFFSRHRRHLGTSLEHWRLAFVQVTHALRQPIGRVVLTAVCIVAYSESSPVSAPDYSDRRKQKRKRKRKRDGQERGHGEDAVPL